MGDGEEVVVRIDGQGVRHVWDGEGCCPASVAALDAGVVDLTCRGLFSEQKSYLFTPAVAREIGKQMIAAADDVEAP